MEQNNWTLTIKFDSLETQFKRDPELAFPDDECSLCIRELMSIWGGLPEEFQEDCEWTSTELKATFEVLDNIRGFLEWLTMHTIPKSVELVRND